ncbi:DUF1643 domain-containing protein [Helicobacter cetorum]|uniref:DUF1643 domain-containing protein n=1 Tax=Helicobacter cetorum TaxID=138563 RepID=UPI000CF0C855|nr:DUF1643 domain-containing protein [Helicobacter cetorum]
MKRSADLSTCRKYRYALYRIWNETRSYAMFIGLNPSTADEVNDDNTIRRCIDFARNWDFGGLVMVNLFAYRTTYPCELFKQDDPIGKDNDKKIIELAKNAGIVVGAWGNNGSHRNRSMEVKKLISNLHYLKLNKSGEPTHPLYIPKTTMPKPFLGE